MDRSELPEDTGDVKKTSVNPSKDFVAPSLLLFLDSIIVSVGSWAYWIVVSRLTTASEIGIAVSVYSLTMLVTTIAQLGLEYPLLKKSSISGTRIVGTCLVIELIITLISIPFIFAILNSYYDKGLPNFGWIAVGLLLFSSIGFVARFSLLGISNVKTVLIVDSIGVGIKLLVGCVLVYMSYGALGMLLAYLLDFVFVGCVSLIVAKKAFSLGYGNIRGFSETLKDALINTPAKWSKVVVISLSIVLLPILGISPSKIGIFYVALTITVFVTSFASSMAYMVIPTSSILRRDLSSNGLRISLSLISPVVTALLVAPFSILSLIGTEYQSGHNMLLLLATTIIPSSVTINMISKLNTLDKSELLVLTGIIQLVTFAILFLILVPIYETIGAAISILIVYLISSAILVILADRGSVKSILSSCMSVLSGIIIGYPLGLALGHEFQYLAIIPSVVASITVILVSKNLTITELRFILKNILQRG